MVGEGPVSVSCHGKAHINPGIEDITTLVLNYANNKFVTIQSSWLDPLKVREMKFVGSKKMVCYDDNETNEKIKVYDKGIIVSEAADAVYQRHVGYRTGDMWAPRLDNIEALKIEAEHFVDCVTNGVQPLSSGQSGLRVVQILEAASRSMANHGQPVEIL